MLSARCPTSYRCCYSPDSWSYLPPLRGALHWEWRLHWETLIPGSSYTIGYLILPFNLFSLSSLRIIRTSFNKINISTTPFHISLNLDYNQESSLSRILSIINPLGWDLILIKSVIWIGKIISKNNTKAKSIVF